MKLFDGKKHAELLDKKIGEYIFNNPVTKSLAIILIGSDLASEKYVGIKEKLCNRLGISIEVHRISEDLADKDIFTQVENIFSNDNVSGGIIQLPLPRKTLNKVLELIPLDKDVDLISPKAQEIYYSDNLTRLSPIVRALEYFLEVNKIDVKGLDTCVIGDGYLVGKPVAHYLKQKNANIDLLSNYSTGCKLNYQLLVLSAGISTLVKGQNVVKGCHILDYGSSVVDGKVKGDLDLDSELDHLGVISPSPGGLGPLVTRFLLFNFLKF
ncbi:MAG: tetrahydrofolate dehydrogenase/cyclohydrolase catalytic domain-containing protein [Patescibacteria group bacterium]